jgi:putative phage-type endonuclease
MENIIKSLSKDVTLVDVKDFTKDQWLAYRKKGLGCSEVGTVMNLNKYSSPMQLFYQKVGVAEDTKLNNMAMLSGVLLEDTVLDMWSYWQGSPDSVVENYDNGTRVREAFKPHVYAHNKKYPWLFGGPDALFMHEGKPAVLEVKTMSSFVRDIYEGGLPPYYITQVYAYMMLFDVDYAELVVLVDGRDIAVHTFEKDEEMVTIIDKEGSAFWANILNARGMEESEMKAIEPKVNGSSAETEFIKERFQGDKQLNFIPQTDDILLATQNYLDCLQKEKDIKEEKTFNANFLKNEMGEHTAIDFPNKDYKVTWNIGKRNRTLSVKKLTEKC